MTPIRVFLVDDSSVIRRLVSDALTADPEVTVVGTASNGKTALAQLPQVQPDLIVMDVEMPEMDGLQTLAAIRKIDHRLPVIMFSSETRRGAVATLDALALGASDYVTKPVSAGGAKKALEYVRAELLPKIKALCPHRTGEGSGAGSPLPVSPGLSGERKRGPFTSGEPPLPAPASVAAASPVGRTIPVRRATTPPPAKPTNPRHAEVQRSPQPGPQDVAVPSTNAWRLPPPSPPGGVAVSGSGNRRRISTRPVEVVVIGVSTGGPAALAELLPALPPGLPVPVLIVLHMPPMFTRLLAERLALSSAAPVHEAADGDSVKPGHVYLAPGGYHMSLVREGGPRIVLDQKPPENHCRPAVDVLFRSVAKAYGAATLAVVLTGMGQDGMIGCELIRAAGGQVIVQDQATSVVWGMPGCVARAGLADEVLPLVQIPAAVTRRVQIARSSAPI